MRLEPGTLFAERYLVETHLGRGAMGEVWAVRDMALGESVALKVLTWLADAAPQAALRFRQEVRLARRVTHPNVARVHDLGEQEGYLFLTMELVRGSTLRELLRESKPLPLEEVTRIGMAICAGLEAAHDAGVVHRDLKPANVLVESSTGRVVISDFGIALCLAEELSLTVGVIGTPNYIAPEQAAGRTVDHRADLYALGVILHELALGALPGAVGDARQLPAPLTSLMARCLEMDPDQRPRSARAAALVLEGLAGGSIVSSAPGPVGPLHLGTRTLAVLPFRYHGPPEQDGLGETLTDELIDVLARTRGLRVLASGATERYKGTRDPRIAARELGAHALVDGTVQLAGDRMRVAVRLVDADGVVLWSERRDVNFGDLFSVQDTVGRCVAEALRVELATITHSRDAPAEAVARYLTARRALRKLEYAAAIEAFSQCLEIAPDFAPAYAGRAIAIVRQWTFDSLAAERDVDQAVSLAVERASGLPEAHFAAALAAAQRGDYRAAARRIVSALDLAPTYAEGHEYLGQLECEAGRTEHGIRRLELARELNPISAQGLYLLARHHALAEDWTEATRGLDELEAVQGRTVGSLMMRFRFALWQRDDAALRRYADELLRMRSPYAKMIGGFGGVLFGDARLTDVEATVEGWLRKSRSARFRTHGRQLFIELAAATGDTGAALRHLVDAAEDALIDVDWLARCRLLAPLRTSPDFARAERLATERARAVWT